MKTNYSKTWLYAVAVLLAILTALLVLIGNLNLGKLVSLAFLLTFLTLVGNIVLIDNYTKISSKSCSTFSIMVWLMSGYAFSVLLTNFITYEKTTFSLTVMIASGLLFLLDGIIYSNENDKETKEYIAEMQRKTDERIAKMKKESDAFIAQMHKDTEEYIARMNKESE